MRWPRALVLIAMLALLAACGGNGQGDGGDDGDDASQGATQSEPAGASAAPPPDDGGGDNGGGDDGGPSGGDLEELLARFEPPNSTEVSRTSADNFLFVIFTSTDSAESLADHYESAIADAGFDTVSRSETQGTYSWIFGDDSNQSAAGVIGVGPTTDGGPGASVSIQLGTGE